VAGVKHWDEDRSYVADGDYDFGLQVGPGGVHGRQVSLSVAFLLHASIKVNSQSSFVN
jgi:hypothetical protein